MQNSEFWTRITNLYGSQNSPVVLCMQNSVSSIWITSLCGSQPSCVVLSIHNSMLSTRIKRLYWFQPSRMVLCMQISDFSTWISTPYWSQPSSVVFAFKTVTFVLELQESVGPRPHMWLLHAKQRLLDHNNKSLCFPHMTCHFVHVQERAKHRKQ